MLHCSLSLVLLFNSTHPMRYLASTWPPMEASHQEWQFAIPSCPSQQWYIAVFETLLTHRQIIQLHFSSIQLTYRHPLHNSASHPSSSWQLDHHCYLQDIMYLCISGVGNECRQNGHVRCSDFSSWLELLTWLQPIVLQQHPLNIDFLDQVAAAISPIEFSVCFNKSSSRIADPFFTSSFMHWSNMVFFTFVTAVSNKVASVTFLQFHIVDSRSTTTHHVGGYYLYHTIRPFS